MSSPCDLPSRGNVAPCSSTTLISTPNTDFPCLATIACPSCGGNRCCSQSRLHNVATATVSVIPQPCRTSIPYLSHNVAIKGRGSPDPPELHLCEGASGKR